MGVWNQGRQGCMIPFPLSTVVKIVHYTLIAGRMGIGCQSRANFPTRQATEMASGSLLEADIS
jgi:hypothetical protein